MNQFSKNVFSWFTTSKLLLVNITNCITARGAVAELNNPLISPIAIFAPYSTLDDFEGKEWNFLFEKNVSGRIFKKSKKYI